VRGLLVPVEVPDVPEGLDIGRESAVEAEDLLLDHRGEGQAVKEVGEELPDLRGAVFTKALVVEAVDLSDLPRLVVPSQDRDPIRVSDLAATKHTRQSQRVADEFEPRSFAAHTCESP